MSVDAEFEMYGRIKEGVHVAGYSFERACAHLEWLLDEGRWKLGGRFDNVNDFLDSIKLDQFRIVTDQRQRIAKRIKELQPEASQRSIAKVVGVDETTIRRDLGSKPAAFAAPASPEPNEIKRDEAQPAAFAAPASADLGGAAVAKLAVAKTEKAEAKGRARDEKEAALAEKISAAAKAIGRGRFGVIYADPPWRFEPYSRDTGMDRAADNHYPTMTVEDIAALKVPAADDCVLFLWATAPMIREALVVMANWGFDYKSQIIWAKDRIGTGYWARSKHEILLIGVRGDIPAPQPGTQPESVIHAPVGAHSAKPAVFAELIERLFPTLPKIELFAREARRGWTGWGAEADLPDPRVQGVPDGHPSTPSSAVEGAKSDGPHSVAGQVGHEPGYISLNAEQEDASAAQTGNEVGSAAPATVDNFQSDGDAFAEVKGEARLANAAGVEPSLSESHPQPSSSQVADRPEPVANGSGTHFQSRPVKPLRPYCQRPENCGGYGRTHCGYCERAKAQSEAA